MVEPFLGGHGGPGPTRSTKQAGQLLSSPNAVRIARAILTPSSY